MDTRPDDFSDASIIRRVLDGDVNAFELVLTNYGHFVSGLIVKYVPGDKVEELAHETFVRAYKSLGTYASKKPFKNWLAAIAVRCCYDYWREQYRRKEVPVSSVSEDCQEWIDTLLAERSAETFSQHMEKREALDLLHWALNRLSAKDRMVLTLTYLEGNTVSEAAEFLGWSIPNVKVRSYRARKKLRKLLMHRIQG